MTREFFEHPILNSPYAYPNRHWELDAAGQPTQEIADFRRRADFVTPIPKPKKRKASQAEVLLEGEQGRSSAKQLRDLKFIIDQSLTAQVQTSDVDLPHGTERGGNIRSLVHKRHVRHRADADPASVTGLFHSFHDRCTLGVAR